MMDERIYPICVIGGGAAGVMAALRAVLNNDECLFFPGSPQDKKRSRALWVKRVENMPAMLKYKRGIEGPNSETLNWIKESDFKDKLILKNNLGITHLSKNSDGIFHLVDSFGESHYAQYVVLCTGVMDVQPVIQGRIDPIFDYANAQTVDYCLICDGHHVLNKKVAILGHETSAAWVAIILHERYGPLPISILTNGEKENFSPDTQKLLQAYGIEINTSPILEIIGEDKGKILKGLKLKSEEIIQVDLAFVALGMIVYNELAKQLGASLDERGFVITDDSGLSSVPGLYVAGDLRANSRKQIYTAWDQAVSAVSAINLLLRQERRKKILAQLGP